MNKLIIIAGPTGTGKTSTALEIARELNGELINADSRQIYKYLNIGTNKGKILLKDNQNYLDTIPIHLINLISPNERFDLFQFQAKALEKINEINLNSKVPILIGGTGLYIDSIVKEYDLTSNENSMYTRDRLDSMDLEELIEILKSEDNTVFDSLNESDKANSRRLIRAIEKIGSNKIKTKFDLEILMLYPEYDWESLKQNIEKRVEQMFDEGLIEETKEILEKGFSPESIGLKVMGYKEVIQYLNKEIDLNTCKEIVKIAHKQYARRQRTWFERGSRNYNLIKYSNSSDAISLAKKFIR